MEFPQKTKNRVTKKDSAIPLLGIYLNRTLIQKDTFSPTFIAALFTTAKTCKQSKCPLAGIKRKVYGTIILWKIKILRSSFYRKGDKYIELLPEKDL